VKSAVLAAGNGLLTVAALKRMGVKPTADLMFICAAVAGLVFGALAHAPWMYPTFAMPSSFCALVLFAGSAFAVEIDWLALILGAYLTLDAMNLYAATASPLIGVCVGIATSLCYAAWIGCYWAVNRK
jgi:hypothetical protein